MTSADEFHFDVRPHGLSYVVTVSYAPGDAIEYEGINDGDSVSLKYNGERILVRDVSREDDGTYWGTVHGFEPSIGLEFDGLERGQDISFREEHVFSCTRS